MQSDGVPYLGPMHCRSVEDLMIMLAAGRLEESNKTVIREGLVRGDKDTLGFMDFVAYLPLFVDIHDDINTNPLDRRRRSLMD